jgi:3'(2'), 5'-bisphosphate nucleotidase
MNDLLLDQLTRLASAAGAAIMDIYAQGFDARTKADASPVTDADHAGEAVILEGLARLMPGIPVIAEEAVAMGAACEAPSDAFLLVDPLDGTREFMARNGEFTVNIALIEGGFPVAGVVYAPALSKVWCGGPRGASAASLTPAREGAAPFGRRAIVSRQAPDAGLTAMISRSHGDAQTEAYLAKLAPLSREAAGSSLKFCRLAEGMADVYPRFAGSMEWDTAAGQAVLEAAGGCVLTPDGRRMGYGKPGIRNGAFVAWGRKPVSD